MRILDKNRANYKKTFSDENDCVFCTNKDGLECKGLSGSHWKVVVNKYPYMDGNVMIIPTRHTETTADISKEEWGEFGKILSQTQNILTKIFKTTSFNIGLNLGKESGASIPHLHWQVVPRKFKNVTVMNTFADLYLVGKTPEETKKLIDEATKNN